MNTPKSVISSIYLTPCRTIGLKRRSSTPKTPINLKKLCTDENSPHLTSLEEKRLARVEERGKSWDDRVKNPRTPLSTRPNCEDRTGGGGVSEGCGGANVTTIPDLLRLSPSRSNKAVRGRSAIRSHTAVNLSPCDGEDIVANNEEKGGGVQRRDSRRCTPSLPCPRAIDSIEEKGTVRNRTHAAINLSPHDGESIATNKEKNIRVTPTLAQVSQCRGSKGVREQNRNSRTTPSLPSPHATESIEEKGTVSTVTHAVITPCSVRLVRLDPNSNSWKVHTPPPTRATSPQPPFTGFVSLDDIRSTVDTLNLKLDRLNQLQQSNIYSKTHDILSLQKSTDKWKEACKDVVLKIQEDLKTKGHEVAISTILREHNIPFEMLDFNKEFDEFN